MRNSRARIKYDCALPQSHLILAELRAGPQRAGLLRIRFGRGMQDTIKLLRRELPPGWSICGAWKVYQTKFGAVKDLEYRLTHAD